MREPRSAFTLLEVLVAMAISVMLLIAVYSVIGYQLRQTQAGRELVEQATLARAVLQTMDRDVRAALTLADAARFRRQPESSSGAMTETTGEGETAAAGATTTESLDEEVVGGLQSGIAMPLGVIGSESDLQLFVSRYPNEVFALGADNGGQLASDQRRISWWVGGDEIGLCRSEQQMNVSDEAITPGSSGEDPLLYQIAAEVRSLEISYFDGSGWTTAWDSSEIGPDGVTPIGSPRAVKIRIGMLQPNRLGELKYYSHVVLIPTAGGVTPTVVPETAEEAGATTSP